MPASRSVSATDRVRAQIDEVFSSGPELGQVLEEVARLGVRLLFQVAFEAEVVEFLGRDRYARGERAQEGQRSGYSPITVRTSAGPITPERPKLHGTREPFASRWLVLDRASVGWRGIDTLVSGIRQLQDLRRQLLPPPTLAATG